MFCRQCGQRLADGARHCPNCGAVISEEERQAAAVGESSSCGDAQGTGSPYGGQGGRFAENDWESVYGQGAAGAAQGTQQSYCDQRYNAPQNPCGQQAAPQSTQGNGAAVAGMILGILSIVCCCAWYVSLAFGVLGCILSVIGLKSQKNHGLAVAGLVMSVIGGIAAVILGIASISMGDNEDFQAMLESIMNEMENGGY